MGLEGAIALVPAAGIGQRMGAQIPKQYLKLAGKTILDRSLFRLLAHPEITKVMVALRERDPFWSQSAFFSDERVIRVPGGAERCHSVLNMLEIAAESFPLDTWVLVHDAARPLVRLSDLDQLFGELADHPVGGLLGLPVRDTMKRTDDAQTIAHTVEREHLWHAFTPQMFRLGDLRDALVAANQSDQWVTDEASAMELAGFAPKMIQGHSDNLKITRPEDLALAEFLLRNQAVD